MSRRRRKLHVRLMRAAAVATAGVLIYRRWQLRASSALPASTYRPVHGDDDDGDSPAPRWSRWAALQQSTAADPFDVLVVGGGLTGLYTAVDAAQRGLRVALVDAGDFGGGSTTSCTPSLSPGALPYVQRAIRQRNVDWLGMAATVLTEQTIWRNVAPQCVAAPDTLRRRWQSWRWRIAVGQSSCGTATGVKDANDTPAAFLHVAEPSARAPSMPPSDSAFAATTLLPALHSFEMAEYVCAAMLSSLMSIFCGPLRLDVVLPRRSVEARLPALAAGSAPASAPVRLRGGIVANDFALCGNIIAVSLARTAEELGVTLLSYAPAFAIQEVRAPTIMDTNPASSSTYPSSGAGVMVVSVRDALAATENLPVPPEPAPLPLFGRRWGQCSAPSPSSTADLDASPSRGVLSAETATTAYVYARTVVNCAGCWADTVKAMYDGNAHDTVPTAFAGYQAYSYLIAPANAVKAALPSFTPPADGRDGRKKMAGACPPLSETMKASALVFSSPRLSFASVMVLPWWDQCVMLGPSISPVPQMPPAVIASTKTALHSADVYAAQRQRTLSMLRSCGIDVDASHLLSCVSQTVPHVKGPQEVPWAGALLLRSYALHFSSLPLRERGGEGGIEKAVSSPKKGADGAADAARRDVPLLHVYGGAPFLARKIAEEAVDALVYHDPPLLTQRARKQVRRCRTRYLQLRTPTSLLCTSDSAPISAQARLEALVKDTYAERLVDVIARRTHVAYTSPVEAIQALPALAGVMGNLLHWDEARRLSEIEAARQLVQSTAVAV
ncbi:hypothetical protein LSCM1_06389 [Leishmania martiniquensis]|uniref:Glycerol-3-phosphate dehydrogenase-like protein n=1 Tax=Leishmania martiniquensis TaxID=1580590 RepID=A0A836H9C3_9TRYP|nr:hypothetical protein LSCM1_06389 [Leishmania martiniquensis]